MAITEEEIKSAQHLLALGFKVWAQRGINRYEVTKVHKHHAYGIYPRRPDLGKVKIVFDVVTVFDLSDGNTCAPRNNNEKE